MNKVKIGILGFGTVGAGVASCLLKNNDVIKKRTQIDLVVAKIADLDITTDRGVELPENVLTINAIEVIEEVDIVIELIGGTTVAKDLILKALQLGKPVVTANKALLAEYGEELFSAAEKSVADIYYEASVAGGIPVIKALREGLAGNRIENMYGIMNGTCNYILTRMENEKLNFDEILKDAQDLGYAETEPSLDVDGVDTAHKAAILAALAYGEWFGMNPIYVEGIRDISLEDIQLADELGYRIKLLSVIKQENDDVQIRVHPTLIPKDTLLGNISDVFNGVMIKGDIVDNTLYYGRGAGRDATASAVVADIVDVALNLEHNCVNRVPAFRVGKQYKHLLKMDEITSRYYLRLQVKDETGVIAKLSTILADSNISISSFVQKEHQAKNDVSLIILTHKAKESNIKTAIKNIKSLDVVNEYIQMIRIEDI